MNSWLGDPTNTAIAALVIVGATLVPVCARIAALHSRRRSGPSENSSHLLKAQGQRVRSSTGSLEAGDRHSQERIRIHEIRRAQHAGVVARRWAVSALLVLCCILFVFSFVAQYPLWFSFLPLVAVMAVLADGIVAARKARRFEAELAHRKTRLRHRQAQAVTVSLSRQKKLSLAAHTNPGRAEEPESRPIRSTRQVAKAVPLTGKARQRIIADLTPSMPVRQSQQSTKAEQPQRSSQQQQSSQLKQSPKTEPADNRKQSAVRAHESLSSDLSDILEHRQA